MTETAPDVARAPRHLSSTFSPEPGLFRRVLAHNQNLMVVEHEMQAGWQGAPHSHPHDQAVYVISGLLRCRCGGQTFEAKAGDSFVVKGGVEHTASALQPSRVLDVFTPAREDYLKKD